MEDLARQIIESATHGWESDALNCPNNLITTDVGRIFVVLIPIYLSISVFSAL